MLLLISIINTYWRNKLYLQTLYYQLSFPNIVYTMLVLVFHKNHFTIYFFVHHLLLLGLKSPNVVLSIIDSVYRFAIIIHQNMAPNEMFFIFNSILWIQLSDLINTNSATSRAGTVYPSGVLPWYFEDSVMLNIYFSMECFVGTFFVLFLSWTLYCLSSSVFNYPLVASNLSR